MNYGNTEMVLHKVSNQRSYQKNSIILPHGYLPVMHICLYYFENMSRISYYSK